MRKIGDSYLVVLQESRDREAKRRQAAIRRRQRELRKLAEQGHPDVVRAEGVKVGRHAEAAGPNLPEVRDAYTGKMRRSGIVDGPNLPQSIPVRGKRPKHRRPRGR